MQAVTASGSGASLSFPSDWKATSSNSNSAASIQMENASASQFVMEIEESTADFSSGYTLADYTAQVQKNMVGNVTDGTMESISSCTIGASIPAQQFEFSGTVQNINLRYLVTCTQDNNYFYQIIAWSTVSNYDAAKPVFQSILDTFKFAS